MPLVPRPLLLPSGRQTMQEWEQGALRPSSYRSVSRRPEVRRTSAAAAGRGSARLGVSGWGARARAEGTGTLHSEARRACGLVLSLRSPGFSDSRRTPGDKHSATPLTTILPLRKLPLWLVLSHFPLSEKKKKERESERESAVPGWGLQGLSGKWSLGRKDSGSRSSYCSLSARAFPFHVTASIAPRCGRKDMFICAQSASHCRPFRLPVQWGGTWQMDLGALSVILANCNWVITRT